MSWLLTTPKSDELVAKKDRIATELEEFRHHLRPELHDAPPDVGAVLQDMHENLFDPGLTVGAVRRRRRLGNNNITSRFRCLLGLGLKDFIEELRIKAACRLLEQPDLEIYLIAMAVGYEHPETFCRAFQRRRGSTPSRWRERWPGGEREAAAAGGWSPLLAAGPEPAPPAR